METFQLEYFFFLIDELGFVAQLMEEEISRRTDLANAVDLLPKNVDSSNSTLGQGIKDRTLKVLR